MTNNFLTAMRKQIYRQALRNLQSASNKREKTVADEQAMQKALLKRQLKCNIRLEILSREPGWRKRPDKKMYKASRQAIRAAFSSKPFSFTVEQ